MSFVWLVVFPLTSTVIPSNSRLIKAVIFLQCKAQTSENIKTHAVNVDSLLPTLCIFAGVVTRGCCTPSKIYTMFKMILVISGVSK